MGGKAGSSDGLAQLFEQHASRLAGALTAAGYPDGADAVQEAFVQAVVHWRKVAHYDDPLQWVRRVAVNRARNRHRGRRRQRAVAERIASQPVTTVEMAQRNDDLIDAIRALPEQQRLALSLHYFADLPVADVAHAMRLTDGAVKYHLHTARTSLARALEVSDGA